MPSSIPTRRSDGPAHVGSAATRSCTRVKNLAPLRDPITIGRRIFNDERSCLIGQPAKAYTVCSRRHAWKATGAVVLSSKRYPASGGSRRSAASAAGRTACQPRPLYLALADEVRGVAEVAPSPATARRADERSRRRHRRGARRALLSMVPAAEHAVELAAAQREPAYGLPMVGACDDMGWKELYRPTYREAPVDCGAKHTSMTLSAPCSPTASRGRTPSNGPRPAHRGACWRAAEAVLGGNGRRARDDRLQHGVSGPPRRSSGPVPLAALRRDRVRGPSGSRRSRGAGGHPLTNDVDLPGRRCRLRYRVQPRHQWRAPARTRPSCASTPATGRCATWPSGVQGPEVQKLPYWVDWQRESLDEPRRWIIVRYSRTSK